MLKLIFVVYKKVNSNQSQTTVDMCKQICWWNWHLGSGFLLIDEFAELLRQLNIEQLSRGEIKEIFDEINTDQVSKSPNTYHDNCTKKLDFSKKNNETVQLFAKIVKKWEMCLCQKSRPNLTVSKSSTNENFFSSITTWS